MPEAKIKIEGKKKSKTPLIVILIVIGVIVLISIASCAACGSCANEVNKELQGDTGEKVGEEGAEETTIGEEQKTFKIGDKVKLNDNIIIVKSVSGYTSSNEFMQPESGKKFIVVDVIQKNGGNEPVDYNVLDFQLQDNKEYTYDYAGMCDKEPAFNYGTLQKGRQVRGFIGFEIPKQNSPKELIFTPSWWGNDQVVIKLK